MNALDLVALLLEADQPSAGDKTGVYIFGPGLPKGHIAKSVDAAIVHLRHFKIIPQGAPDDVKMLDALIDKGYVFIIKHHPGNVEVIGKKVPVRVSSEVADQAEQFLGLEQHDAVAYRKHTTDSPKRMLVDYVLHGSKEMEQAEKQKQQAAKEKRTVPTRQLGDIDPQEQGWKEPPTGQGYEGEFMPSDAPVEIGLVYKDTEKGLRVMEVIPGGPAAQAGMQAGDFIVQVREFVPTGSDEKIGPYYVYNKRDMDWVLRKADPQHAIPFRWYRGDQEMTWPIKPEPKKEQAAGQGAQVHIPGEEVRRYFQRPKVKRQGPYQRTFTRKLMKPNEPTPARETGNERPNVSSVT